jgi:hypothetical protein
MPPARGPRLQRLHTVAAPGPHVRIGRAGEDDPAPGQHRLGDMVEQQVGEVVAVEGAQDDRGQVRQQAARAWRGAAQRRAAA